MALYGLFRGAFSDEVEARLATYAPRDWGPRRGRVRLPWRWSSQPEKVRWLYGKMGLGGEGVLAQRGGLRPSATLGAALGLCLGLVAAAGTVALRPPGLEEWTDPESGIAFLRIPGGRFLMGSPGTALRGRPRRAATARSQARSLLDGPHRDHQRPVPASAP